MASSDDRTHSTPGDLDRALAEIRRLEEELAGMKMTLDQHRQELVYNQKMATVGRLIAGIAHEIRTPIGAINSMQDTLQRAVEKLKKSMDAACPGAMEDKKISSAFSFIDEAQKVIGSGSGRTLEIVRRVQKFARMDEATLVETDLHAELDDTLLLLNHHLKNRITIQRDFGEIPRVTCNVGQINQVLLNVLVNAAQAMDGEGTITISTRLEDGLVHVAIRDTGHGIPPEHMAKLFKPGFTTKKAGAGTGLGLSICAQIVEEHRGKIEVQSEVGVGTVVDISLSTELSAS